MRVGLLCLVLAAGEDPDVVKKEREETARKHALQQEATATAVYEGKKHLRPFGVDTAGIWGGFEKWAGAVTVGSQVFFAPASSDFILVMSMKTLPKSVDPDTGRPKEEFMLDKISTHEMMDSVWGDGVKTSPMGPGKWAGVAAHNGHVYFVPFLADCVMDLNVEKWNVEHASPSVGNTGTAALSAIPIPRHLAKAGSEFSPGFGTEKWLGASVVGGDLYLAPSYLGDVPVVNLADKSVSARDAKPFTGNTGPMQLPMGGHFEWRGSASVGNKVYYAPHDADSILVLEAGRCNTSNAELAAKALRVGHRAFCNMYKIKTESVEIGRRKWFGAVAVGKKVVFSPDDAQTVLVLDTTTDTLTGINVSHVDDGASKWRGAVAIGTKVFFAPYNSPKLLIVDVAGGSILASPDVSVVGAGVSKWMGGTAVGKPGEELVVFSPFSAKKILMFDTTGYEMTWEQASDVPPPPPTSLRESFLQTAQTAHVSVNFRGEVEAA